MPAETDLIFRNIMLAGAAILIPIAVYYRARSNATREKLDRRHEGLFLGLSIRIFGGMGMLGVIAFLLDPANMSWASVPLPIWLRWAGIVLGFFAGGLWIYTFHHLGENLTDTVVTRIKHALVTSGPYRWVRHPFYVAVALLTIANSLATANWFICLTMGTTFLLLVIRTDKEEEKLVDRFGDAYREYMERVGRFFPKFL